MDPLVHGTSWAQETWSVGNVKLWSHGTVEPRNSRVLQPWTIATMAGNLKPCEHL